MRADRPARAKVAPGKPPASGAKGRPLEHIRDLVADPANARKHGPRNVGTIVAALQEVGAARSIVIDEDGVILAGNATVDAAAEAGITRVQVVEADGQTIVAVRRRGLSPQAKARLALFDNRAAELAEGWEVGVLRDLQTQGVSLEGLWSADELLELLAGAAAKGGLTDPDAIPAERPTDIRLGDLFELGTHRLLCGDSTSGADVARVLGDLKPRLMVTDPPYGVEYDPSWRAAAGLGQTERTGAVANDDRVDWTAAWDLFPGDVAYVWHAGIYASEVAVGLAACGFEVRSQIIWRKSRFALSRGHYHWQHEPCWYVVRKGRQASWAGSRNQATVWNVEMLHSCASCGAVTAEAGIEGVPTTVWEIEHADGTGKTTHSTQKPVECMARGMRNHKAREIYEPFNGSGSTLIACEQLGRVGLAIELNPSYVQQTIDRWEAFTGRTAAKVGEAVLGG